MKLNKLAMVLGFGVALTAGAANASPPYESHGTVKFSGSIIDAPCSIKNTNIDVNLGAVSSHILKDGGRSESKAFKIELQNCTAETKNGVKTTFTGAEATEKGLLGIEGTASGASGAAIAITNAGNKIIPLGTESDKFSLHEGSNDLNFAAYLKGLKDENGKGEAKPGDFTAIANFTLNYL
ncbi:fimbrial protein [Xenorhabdus bovienii]|uniref:Major MR/P fimbria protein n=1 Tax=Xenorhabdus bovienii str. feltiae Moldova TaxID=1398200 RepID=A0A077NXB1_XENBV|nr:fimbrial protein [Xenorhabdus bovienii]CDH02286.1 Major MR/P fimbria protein precursor [Xenorhabdus bovienii str. feltiae Moldova]